MPEEKELAATISTEIPAIYHVLKKKFGVNWDNELVITYGKVIHSKNAHLLPDVVAHELTHVKQQEEMGDENWWIKYLEDPKFRLEQEVEAYKWQVRFLRDHTESTTRDFRRWRINKMAEDLASSQYGYLVTYKLALELIK